MSAPESSPLDLYNRLRDALGTELADNLMADVRSEIADLRYEMRQLSQRIDRLYQAMIGGFAAMVAALIASGLLN